MTPPFSRLLQHAGGHVGPILLPRTHRGSPDTVKHILLDCIDLRDTRIKYYRDINSLKKLFNENIFNINYLKEVGLYKKF